MEQLNLANIRITTVLTAIAAGSIAVFFKSLPPQIPLLYTLPWGNDQIVALAWLWSLPITIVLVGSLTSFFLPKSKFEPLLVYLWLGSIWVFQTLLMLATLRILWLVI